MDSVEGPAQVFLVLVFGWWFYWFTWMLIGVAMLVEGVL